MTPAAAQVTFDKYEVDIGPAKHQTVLSGFLLGGTVADLAVVNVDEIDQPTLRIYAYDGNTWIQKIDAILGRETRFVDVANIGGRDRLVTYGPGQLYWFDPESLAERELVSVTSNFNPPRKGEIPHVFFTRDMNGNGRDDLVMPDADGFHLFVQLEGGSFADPVQLGHPFESGKFNDDFGYRFNPWDQSRIHEMDYDQNGRSDLVFWYRDHFEVHSQDERGRFDPVAKTFTTDIAFDSDDPAFLAGPEGFRRRRMDNMPKGAMNGSILHSLKDMNGDGVADLVVFSMDIKSMFSASTNYEVYFGSPTPDGGTVFAPEVGTAIRSNGVLFMLEQYDFDRDGRVDMMFATIKIGFLKTIRMIVGALLTRKVSMNLEFYSMDSSIYPNKPNAKRKIKTVSLGKSGERAAVKPSVLVGDVTGDERPDLVVQKGRKELRVYHGVLGPDLFTRRPNKIKVAVPNEEYTWLANLKKDSRQSILMHHVSTNGPDKVTILTAR